MESKYIVDFPNFTDTLPLILLVAKGRIIILISVDGLTYLLTHSMVQDII
jgi:hypothetical protein